MSSELHLDPSPLGGVTNHTRARAALTVCDRLQDKWPVTESLVALGLIEQADGRYLTRGGDEDEFGTFVTWSPSDRGPAGSHVATIRTRMAGPGLQTGSRH